MPNLEWHPVTEKPENAFLWIAYKGRISDRRCVRHCWWLAPWTVYGKEVYDAYAWAYVEVPEAPGEDP